MQRTEVVERPDQIHPLGNSRKASRCTSRASPQHGQARAKRPVQPLDGGGVEHLAAWRAPQQGQKQARTSLNQAMHRARHRTTSILFDHLRNRHLWPGNQPWASPSPRLARPKGLAHRINVRHQAVSHEQQRPL